MAKAHKPKNLPPGNAVARKKLSDLTQDAKNANKGTARGNAMIEKSLRDYGAGRSILLDKHGAIIAGNKTAQNAAAAGLDDVLVIKTDGRQLVAVQRIDLDLKDAKTRSLAITDNRANEVSLSWDVDVLKAFTAEGFDLAPFWNADELEDLWPQNAELQTDEDEVPAVPVEAVAKLGDLYILGDHRLLCGDSTVLADVERLMGGQKADMVFTDPPYGIGYQHTKRKHAKIANDAELGAIPDLIRLVLLNTCPLFICCNWKSWSTYERAMIEAEKPPKSCIVWDKKVRIQNLDKFYKQHEFIAYYGPFGGQKTVAGDVWRVDREVSSDHPTAKPVALIEQALEYASMPKQIIQDLFGDSGSTLIACEKTRRRCFMMELSPAYVDVIRIRWELATGKKAVLSV
jgi:DNA modification methylase